jgi:hypothetical protein
MAVLDRFLAMFAAEVWAELLHWPWSIESNESDNILESVWTHANARSSDAITLELKDSSRISTR